MREIKEIILVRHAKVDVKENAKIATKNLKAWVEKYDVTDLHSESIPSQALHDTVNKADFLVTSSLSRAIASANFFNKKIDEKDSAFNELPMPNIKIPYFEFKAKTWLIILRIVLLFTNKKNKEVEEGVTHLLEYSAQHDILVLVGHGGINYYMHKTLRKKGWKLKQKPSIANWGTMHLYKKKVKHIT